MKKPREAEVSESGCAAAILFLCSVCVCFIFVAGGFFNIILNVSLVFNEPRFKMEHSPLIFCG